MENNKKGNGLIITLIVLLLVLIGLVGFYIYNDMNNKDKNNENNNVSNNASVTKLTKDSQIVQYLNNIYIGEDGMNLTVDDGPGGSDGISRLLSANKKDILNEKLRIAYKSIFFGKVPFYKDSVKCSDLQNYKLSDKNVYDNIVICGDKYLLSSYGNSYDEISEKYKSKEFNEELKSTYVSVVKKETFDKVMKLLFGEDINYTYEDLEFRFTFDNYTIVKFDKKVNGYVMYHGYGGSGTIGFDVKLIDIKQDENKLSLYYGESETQKKADFILNFELDKNGNYIFVDAVKE